MAVQDTVTDDILAYCLNNPGKLNAIRAGTVSFQVRDRHIVAVDLHVEERVGYEIDRSMLDKVIARLHRSAL